MSQYSPAHMSRRGSEVIFVTMPYASVERPSVALGTLTASLNNSGISAQTVYGNLLFAERIGMQDYEGINNSDITSQIGEWTFSYSAFRKQIRDTDEYVTELCREGHPPTGLKDALLRVRTAATLFIEELAAQIVSEHPRVVGCSSVFQQHCASLALLRRIREIDPSIVTMLGGANCEAAMGVVTHQQYRWVDFVVSGEADHLLPDLCRLVFEYGRNIPLNRIPFGVLGPATHAAAGIKAASDTAPRALIKNLDELPVPNYDDYFRQLGESKLRDWIIPGLALETSRGCWWGAKHHCTFCGLNGDGMAFRAKSEDRVQSEIEWLADRYQVTKFMTVDNILDNRYFNRVLPALSERGNMRVFYETKANLTRSQVEMLSHAGVRWIQPGIEALHDGLLTLIKKGCTAAINVQLLKWARTYGVWVIWNHLYGAPGDRQEWYDEIAEWLPQIIHLQPPTTGGMTRIRFDRFSPYFNSPASFGLNLAPYWAYGHVYPLDEHRLMDHAYFFRHAGEQSPAPARLIQLVQHWAACFYGTRASASALPKRSDDAPVLEMSDDGTRIFIRDTRPCAAGAHHQLDELESAVCRSLDSARSKDAVYTAVRQAGLASDGTRIDRALQSLMDRKIVADFSGKFLCLATDDTCVPYLSFEEFAGGLALLSGRRPAAPDPAHDPWDTPVHELF